MGFKMIGHENTEFVIKANPAGGFDSSPIIVLQGPPTGFKILMGESSGRGNTPQAMQTTVNECACDFSFFIGGAGPREMNTDSVSGTPDTQLIPN